MLRFNPPFNGHRFLLNKNTGEIHDLTKETEQCQIDSINPEHIYTGSTYLGCLLYAEFKHCPDPNGCFYCQPEKDNG